MKLKTIIVMALATTISASAGAFDREEILKDVAKMNAEMPMSMGMMGTMTGTSMTDEEMQKVMNYANTKLQKIRKA